MSGTTGTTATVTTDGAAKLKAIAELPTALFAGAPARR
jgi:hypothetical protein